MPARGDPGFDQGAHINLGVEPHHGQMSNAAAKPAPTALGSEHHGGDDNSNGCCFLTGFGR
jgi:hypothetical protein